MNDFNSMKTFRDPVSYFLCLVFFLLTVAYAYPGNGAGDELTTLSIKLNGQLNDVQPPFHTILYYNLLQLMRFIGGPPKLQLASMLFFQAVVFWGAVALLSGKIKHVAVRRGLILILGLSPAVLNHIGSPSKDVLLGVFLLLSFTLLFLQHELRSSKLAILNTLVLSAASLLRYDSIIAVSGLLYFQVTLFFETRKINLFRRTVIFVACLLALYGAQRLSDRIFVDKHCCKGDHLYSVMNMDLLGMSKSTGALLFPPTILRTESALTPIESLKRLKSDDPFNFFLHNVEHPLPKDLQPITFSYWKDAIVTYPLEFLRQKGRSALRILGITPWHQERPIFQRQAWKVLSTDTTPGKQFIMSAEVDKSSSAIREFVFLLVNAVSQSVLFRPWFYLLLAGGIFSVYAYVGRSNVIARSKQRLLSFYLASAFTIFLPHLCLAIVDDFRYFSSMMLASLVVSAIAVDSCLEV